MSVPRARLDRLLVAEFKARGLPGWVVNSVEAPRIPDQHVPATMAAALELSMATENIVVPRRRGSESAVGVPLQKFGLIKPPLDLSKLPTFTGGPPPLAVGWSPRRSRSNSAPAGSTRQGVYS